MRFVSLPACLLLFLSACQTTSQSDTMRVCNSAGCSDVPTQTATYDPSTAVPDEDPDGRLGVLVALAEDDPRAAFDLGMRYMRGDGIGQNSWEAIKWMRNAGERGDREAQSALGRLYLTGLEETGPDYNEAQRWLSLAASRGDREAASLLEEAEALRADEQAYFNWVNRWRYRTDYYWYRSPYYWAWNGSRWSAAY